VDFEKLILIKFPISDLFIPDQTHCQYPILEQPFPCWIGETIVYCLNNCHGRLDGSFSGPR